MLELAGNRTVPIEIGSKYTDSNWSQKLMKLREFINEFILVSENDNENENENENENNSARSCLPDNKGYLAQHPLFDQV